MFIFTGLALPPHAGFGQERLAVIAAGKGKRGEKNLRNSEGE